MAWTTDWLFVFVIVLFILVIIIGISCELGHCLKCHPLSFLLCFEGSFCADPPVGGVLRPLSFYATLHTSSMTPKDTSAFQLLVIYLCSTHVKLEIHLSLPDNNVQNGASCMNHYLQPGVVLLMNIHEARDGKERFVQPISWRSFRWFSSMLKSGLLAPSPA